MPTNIRPVFCENIVQFSGPGLFQKKMSSPTPCSWEQQSHPGANWASIEDDHIKRRLCISPGSEWSWSWELNTLPFTHCPRMVSSSWISNNKTSLNKPMPQTTPEPRSCCCMLVNRSPNWNKQHWSHAKLNDESRVSLYHSGRHAANIVCFLDATIH